MSIINRLKNRVIHLRRSSLGRKLENRLRFSGKKFVTLGDTNVFFYRPGWETLDLFKADYTVDIRKDPLPFANDTLDAVHSSHTIEHISYDEGLKLLQEIYRCLKSGGYLRLSTPDMSLLIDRYKKEDWRFFLQADGNYILQQICKGILPADSLLLHNLLVHWFASYSGRLDTAGGPIVNQQIVEEKLATLSKYKFRDWCVSLLESERVYAHVHVYDFEELKTALEKVGFQKIRQVSYGESDCPAMIKPPIDVSKHQIYSFYVEAIK